MHVVEGGDSGWRIGYQYLDEPAPARAVERGAAVARALGRAARLPHPADHAHRQRARPGWPTTPAPACGRSWDGHFFLVDFRGGQASQSGIHTFTLTPQGAGFELVEPQQFVWGVLATDVDFGPDGAAYLSDWVHGWPKPGKGRLWQVFDPTLTSEPDAQSTRKLLAEGMAGKSPGAAGLAAGRARSARAPGGAARAGGAAALGPLVEVARRPGPTVPRLHAVWGLGQICPRGTRPGPLPTRRRGGGEQGAARSLAEADAEVRAQAAVALGDARSLPAREALAARLTDESPRVRFFSAIALGKLGTGRGGSRAAGPACEPTRTAIPTSATPG